MATLIKPPVCGPRQLVAKTCLVCGEFKLGAQFPRNRGGHNKQKYWSPYCKTCHGRMALATARRTNTESLDTASHYQEEWSPSEVKLLWELDAQGLSTRQIGERLGRTESGISVKKAKTRVIANPVYLCYYEERSGEVRVASEAFDVGVKRHLYKLNRMMQGAVEHNPTLIFFLTVEDESDPRWQEVSTWESRDSMR